MSRISFVELPAIDVPSTKAFYAAAFGWAFTDYGARYACTTTGDVDLGLQGDPAEAPRAPLPVIEVADLAVALAAVEHAGGIVTKPVFAFPGGRRFHFTDPSGNELSAMQPD